MKKFIFVAMMVLIAFPLVSCSGKPSNAPSNAPSVTPEQRELVKRIRTSKSAIAQAKYYRQLWESLEKQRTNDPATEHLRNKRDALEAELKNDLARYSLSVDYLMIRALISDSEASLEKDIAILEEARKFIGRIKADPLMEEAFLLAKANRIQIDLADHFKVDEQGFILIDYQASDVKIVEFLLGPEESRR